MYKVLNFILILSISILLIYVLLEFLERSRKNYRTNRIEPPEGWHRDITVDGINYDPVFLRNCNTCKYINITEKEQKIVGNTKSHMCLKHMTKVIHRSSDPYIYHDYIYPCDKCNGKDYIPRK